MCYCDVKLYCKFDSNLFRSFCVKDKRPYIITNFCVHNISKDYSTLTTILLLLLYNYHNNHHHISRKTSTAGHRPPPNSATMTAPAPHATIYKYIIHTYIHAFTPLFPKGVGRAHETYVPSATFSINVGIKDR
jgi:hypothetical protein